MDGDGIMAYDTALEMLGRNRVVVCVSGILDGEAVVSVRSWPLEPQDDDYVYCPSPDVRACYLAGVVQVARQMSRDDGMVIR